MQILQINRLYEMNKDRGATILIPTSMAESMGRLLSQLPPGTAQLPSETTASRPKAAE
jgi:hypothetical protein